MFKINSQNSMRGRIYRKLRQYEWFWKLWRRYPNIHLSLLWDVIEDHEYYMHGIEFFGEGYLDAFRQPTFCWKIGQMIMKYLFRTEDIREEDVYDPYGEVIDDRVFPRGSLGLCCL